MATEFHKVTEGFWVSAQLEPRDVTAAAAQGFRTIMNNRPDGEEPGQPSGSDVEAAARAVGLDYVAVPIRGRPGPAQMRSIAAWALAEGSSGARSRAELVGLARDAGYDLSQVL
jgi:protein tyrosine phosphatase (PTP) superfamily phosphohydrolase (DUF442 family)